jgi:hypothetical protein
LAQLTISGRWLALGLADWIASLWAGSDLAS